MLRARFNNLLSLILLSFITIETSALISPEDTGMARKEWMADVAILVPGSDDDYVGICQGALIDPFWVLSSFGCLYDPYEAIENIVESEELVFGVFLGVEEDEYKVAEYFIAPERDLLLLRLNRAAEVQPIAVSYQSAEDLLGKEVHIYNDLVSDAFAHSFWNPQGDIDATCTVDGSLFSTEDALCYILDYPERMQTLQSITGTVIDPSGDAIQDHPINEQVITHVIEDQFYLDLDSGYPCLEDIGSPIVSMVGGKESLVGFILATGATAGLSMCGSSFANFFLALGDSREEFINTSMTAGEFDQVCPEQPELDHSLEGNNQLTLNWDAQANADGYKLFSTPAVGYIPIEVTDVGNVTEFSGPIDASSNYSFALVAYNDFCSSTMSEVMTLSR